MRVTRENMGWSRVAVLTWTALWMLAAPLVHIHPEADHHHGEAGHVHGGTVHTVFSPDLSCEFTIYDHVSVAAKESSCPLHLIAQPFHGAEHLEIDLILASSVEPQVGKGTTLDVAARSCYANEPTRPHVAWRPQPSPSLTDRFLTTSLTSRAPPSV
ncbi:MAG: hypothetical protein P0120_19520 [Nitrospira sp.]|nr:hypothetical protein [Nitrospira sp.]